MPDTQDIKKHSLPLILRWTARIASIGSVALILAFFIGEGFNPSSLTLREWAGFLFFPLGTVTGMIVAWKREGAGGVISVGSLLAFYIVHFLFSGTFPRGYAWIVFSSPGILFLASWLLRRGNAWATNEKKNVFAG